MINARDMINFRVDDMTEFAEKLIFLMETDPGKVELFIAKMSTPQIAEQIKVAFEGIIGISPDTKKLNNKVMKLCIEELASR